MFTCYWNTPLSSRKYKCINTSAKQKTPHQLLSPEKKNHNKWSIRMFFWISRYHLFPPREIMNIFNLVMWWGHEKVFSKPSLPVVTLWMCLTQWVYWNLLRLRILTSVLLWLWQFFYLVALVIIYLYFELNTCIDLWSCCTILDIYDLSILHHKYAVPCRKHLVRLHSASKNFSVW